MTISRSGVAAVDAHKVDSKAKLPDIKPYTNVSALRREDYRDTRQVFPTKDVSVLAGMSGTFVRKVVGHKGMLSMDDVLTLLDQDSFRETIVPRSRVINYLLEKSRIGDAEIQTMDTTQELVLLQGHVLDLLHSVPRGSVQCVVTSTPYWGMRIYDEPYVATWADGEASAYGHEQTPDGFLRHTTEILSALYDVLADDGSIWWNIMDSFNTRTQIRGSAVEALRAMQGKDSKSWTEQECRRYSAGHAYLKDGEQCAIPGQIAERASRIGYYVKSVITWAKTSTLPEPQESRVSRNLEYVLHLSKVRKPLFQKQIYRQLSAEDGGRQGEWETDKLSDVWTLPTSSGGDGHGAQFPVALPARCIALSSRMGDLVLDPFVGAGNSGLAARRLGRRFLGFDVCGSYLKLAKKKIDRGYTSDYELLKHQSPELSMPRRLL